LFIISDAKGGGLMKIEWPGHTLDLCAKTAIMGILNVTPDSFSDGSLYLDKDLAVRRALQMVEEGADIIDIGGESTRPGSEAVPLDEELERVIPVIKAVAARVQIPVSIDTYKASVARRAIEAGASMVNDISGLRFDAEMAAVAAIYRVPVILMHIKGTPRDMQRNPEYEAVVPEVMDYLRASIGLAEEAGIDGSKIIIDPGIGFGKTFDHNLQILRDLQEFEALQKPILVGVSRKAFIGKILGGAAPSERLEGTAAAVTAAIMNGANIIRVHDVKEMARVARVADAIKRGTVDRD
jgi:dihydropteroate synthase